MGIDTVIAADFTAKHPRWRVDATGCFALIDSSGRDVTPRGRKARGIIAYLSLNPGEHVLRERLTELLWGDRADPQARASLRQALLEIRHCCDGLVSADREHLWIERSRLEELPDEQSACCDTELFEDLGSITPEFDEWLRCERSRRADKVWCTLEDRAEQRLARNEGAEALPLIERMQRIDPYNEDGLRLAMRAEFQAGHPAGIRTRFQQFSDLLTEELGVGVSAQTRALHDELLAKLTATGAEAPLEAADRMNPPTEFGPAIRKPLARKAPWLALAGGAAILATVGLSQSAHTAQAEAPRIAVLPFAALGGVDPMLAEGMAAEMLTTLSQQRELETVGRTSSWMFKDEGADLRRVGKVLDADYVVEGSLRRMESGLRLTVSLIDTRDASTLWSRRFVSASGDAQRMEDAAGSALMQHLGFQGVADRRTDPRAYANYVRAKAHIRDRNWPKMREARDLLSEAVRIDPNFAPAWAQLGGTLYFTAGGEADARAGLRRAEMAARRSIALDPKLAEGHAMLALILGFASDEGRAHLRHALQLDPRNPQTLYWWGSAAQLAGNYSLAEKAVRRAMELDPLWRRAVQVAAKASLVRGRRAEAYSYLARLRTADPNAALEVEMDLLQEQGDLSRVVELGRSEDNIAAVSGTSAKMTLCWSLNQMGYVREALLIGGASPFDRLIYLRKLPDSRTILSETEEWVGTGEEPWMLMPLLLELARAERHSDIAALFDRPGSGLNRLQHVEDGNRTYRVGLAAILGQSMRKLGRRGEAERLFRAADEANRVLLANSVLPPGALVEIAVGETILGRRERALALLERAVSKGWFAFDGSNYRIDEMPGLTSLRGDPRFDRLVQITNSRRERERRETEALGLI